MSKVLITGGAGFVGLHLARRLHEAGHQLELLDNLSRGSRDADLEALSAKRGVLLLERDLRRPDALEGLASDYEIIVHLAAIVGVANVLDAPYRVLEENVELLRKVMRFAASQDRLERLVFASTSEAYAGTLEAFGLPIPTPEAVPLTLADLREPRTSYMLSKIYGEALCLHSRLPFTILRPHNVFGPRMGMTHVIPELLQRAYAAPNAGALEVYSVEHRRTFCFIDDAVEMIARAAFRGECEGEVLNVGAQHPELSIGEVARLVVETVGKVLDIVPLPATEGSPKRRCPDMSKTLQLTSYTPRVTLEEGVRRTYEWYRPRLGRAARQTTP